MTSIRAASQNGWMHHLDGQFIGGVLLFWLVALRCSRVGDVEHSLEDPVRTAFFCIDERPVMS